MYGIELPMRKAYLIIGFLLMSTLSSCLYANGGAVVEFAERLKNIITYGEIDQFSRMSCGASRCVDKEYINYIFGTDDQEGFVKSFLGRPSIKIKIFGPYWYSDRSKGNDYALVYYDPAIVKFNSDGHLSDEDRRDLWWVGYIETVVSFHDGNWGFTHTPFYYGAHIPWAEDY